jgi:hypothetical protein
MNAKEVNEEIIGKRCKCIFTGLMVTGTIEDIKISVHTAEVKVRYDKPHQWGNHSYEDGWAFARLHDGFGSLQYLEIIDDTYKTIKVRFEKGIAGIDRMLAQNYNTWGAVNLKEWIDTYESSRFIRIDEHTAIITSGYNMDCIREWLAKNTPIQSIETLI